MFIYSPSCTEISEHDSPVYVAKGMLMSSFVVRGHCALTGLRYAEAESNGNGIEEARNAAEAINL
jgi:hypothetical protein